MFYQKHKPMSDKEFQDRMWKLPEPPNNSAPPQWDYWRHDLWGRGVNGFDPKGFAGWPCIYHTMRVDHWRDATDQECAALRKEAPDLLAVCEMPVFGYPKDYYEGVYSAALIHQAHHLLLLRKHLGIHPASMDTIFEFGGGYGAMALVIRRLGFKGDYTIMDLPEFALLQQYFLSNNEVWNVKWTGAIDHTSTEPYDLFIACYSLSEVDYEMRQRTLSAFPSSNYLFLYTNRFASYDNEAYFFDILPKTWQGHEWEWIPAKHLPVKNYYSFGRRR